MNKNGFIADIGIYIVMLFAISVAFIAIYYLIGQINTSVQNDPGFGTVGQTMMSDSTSRFVGIYDSLFVLLVVGFIVVLVITGFALRSHPIFAMITILVLIIFAVIAVHLANTYYDVANDSALLSSATEFSKMTWLMTKLPHIAIVAGIIFIIILYAKSRSSNSISL